MAWHLNQWWRNRILEREEIPQHIWQKMIHLRCLNGMDADELRRLQALVLLFLHAKVINGAHDLEITDEMRVTVALQACVLILNLGLDYYDDWIEIIVYPGEFILEYDYADEAGVVHHARNIVSGEAWLSGPVILSWQEMANTHAAPVVHNVFIHEFAHKLDMLHEGANGCPPLHANMSAQTWCDVFSHAYAAFCSQVEEGADTAIDIYAAESPAEFFAVLSEVFFESPAVLKQHFVAVYEQLALFYRQDPAKRVAAGGWPRKMRS
ncbi:hypothetical protein SAMN05421690_100332 [Nitrosomonas sp. Nm51]|uniref:M90 family metallopeptidase n=1 Tax=Nitrosomonas sp. Nm51 TaxID=133720 RepID=UPI0008B43E2D|nr:M90 family metallopeptidase [Nitrosomonas sp. Nm51]SEQ89284.1 hypothetical protein SAMN05421690_100332 [Nitrosomonas sp. Nm51]